MICRVSNPARRILIKGLLSIFAAGFMVMSSFVPTSIQGQPDIDPNVEFVEFWGDYESIFLYHPSLIKEIFLYTIKFKGNRRVATRHIDSEVLSCAVGKEALSDCRVDQLKLERKKRRMSRYLKVPINVSSVTGHPIKNDESRYVLTVKWQPVMVKPPVLTLEEFYQFLGIAKESKYYVANDDLNDIQINSLFEDRVTIVTPIDRAKNIINLYQEPPTDLKDAFVYRVDRVNVSQIGSRLNVDVHLKAVKAIVNHLSFKTTKELLQ